MPAILGVRVNDRFLELSSPKIESFGKLFDIDSVNLLLGKNGSGKTRFLVALARAFASPSNENAKIYFRHNENRFGINHEPADRTCAIYYSALPYKRKMKRRAGLIDASPSAKNVNDASRLLRIGEVARELGIDTRLTAFFGYSRIVYRSVLIPALRRAIKASDSDLREMVEDYYHLDDSGTISYEKGIGSIDSEKEAVFIKIESYLEQEIANRLGNYDKILFLTCLEYMHGRAKEFNTPEAASAFLEHIGLTRTGLMRDHFYELEEFVEKTRSTLTHYANPEDFYWDSRIQKFQIDSVWALEAIRQYETPIKIEWSNLSSGLQALVEQFALIDEAISQAATHGRLSVLLLIDEGDAYLHLDWQRRYISLINKYLGHVKKHHNLDSLQLILATHSPLLAADVPGTLVTNLDTGATMKTFAAPLEEVIAGSFDSSSLGEFAATKINEIHRRAQQSKLTDADHHIIAAIGDVAIQAALKGSIGK